MDHQLVFTGELANVFFFQQTSIVFIIDIHAFFLHNLQSFLNQINKSILLLYVIYFILMNLIYICNYAFQKCRFFRLLKKQTLSLLIHE